MSPSKSKPELFKYRPNAFHHGVFSTKRRKSDHVQAVKGGSAREVFLEIPDLRWQMGENHLWGRRFWAEEVPPDAIDAVRNYIRNQEAIHLGRLGWQPVPVWERWIELD